MNKEIKKRIKGKICLKGVWRFTLRNVVTGKIDAVYIAENIIPTCARTMIANNLTSTSPTNAMRINYTSLGTGTNAVDNANTQLQTEVYRKLIASETNDDNIAYATHFYGAAECNGTYYEAGLFCDATATANSGVLFSRVLLNAPTGITKSAVQSLTIDYILTIS
jgi:hypothetical protein